MTKARDIANNSSGALAAAALPKSGGALTGAVTTNSTIDGRDVAADGVLATNALPKSGGTVTGTLGVSTAANNYVTVTATNNNTRAGYLSSSKKSDGTVVKTWIRSEEGGIGSIFTETNHNLGFATNNAAPQMTLSTSGNLGIGVSPTNPLHVSSSLANSVVSYFHNTDTSNGQGILVRGGGSNSGKYIAQFQDAAANTRMQILANGTATLGDPSFGGNLGKLRIIEAGTSRLSLFGTGNIANGGDFAKLEFAMQTGGFAGQVVAQVAGKAIGTSENAANLVFSTATGGTLSERIRVDADGLKFHGDTAAANALNDYEEGTWTPTLGGNTTYNYQNGYYRKIGSVVHILMYLDVSSIGTGSTTVVSGLPFGGNSLFAPASGVISRLTAPAVNVVSASAQVGSTMYTLGRTGAGATSVQAIWGSGTAMYMSCTFMR